MSLRLLNKLAIGFVFFSLLACPITGARAESIAKSVNAPTAPIFVFDLDDTLIRYVHQGEATLYPLIPGIIQGERYQRLNGALELVESLRRDYPGSKIVFYSGGSGARNHKVLAAIREPDGKSFLRLASQVVSQEDFQPSTAQVGREADPTVSQKDLRLIDAVKGAGLDNVILIDDNPQWIMLGQERNFLWVGSGFSPGRLARARGLIDEAWALSQHLKMPFADALQTLQWRPPSGRLKDGVYRYNTDTFSEMSLYLKGMKRFQAVNPSYRLVPLKQQGLDASCIVNALNPFGSLPVYWPAH